MIRADISAAVIALAGGCADAQDADSPAMFLAFGVIADASAFQEYAAIATPALEASGGTIVAGYRATESQLGDPIEAAGVVFIMRFESVEALRAALSGADYAEAISARERAFSDITFWVAPE